MDSLIQRLQPRHLALAALMTIALCVAPLGAGAAGKGSGKGSTISATKKPAGSDAGRKTH